MVEDPGKGSGGGGAGFLAVTGGGAVAGARFGSDWSESKSWSTFNDKFKLIRRWNQKRYPNHPWLREERINGKGSKNGV